MNYNKKQLLISILILTLVGILGFYGGRYYEQQVFRKRMFNRGQANGRFYGNNGTSPQRVSPLNGQPGVHMEFRK